MFIAQRCFSVLGLHGGRGQGRERRKGNKEHPKFLREVNNPVLFPPWASTGRRCAFRWQALRFHSD